MSHDRNRCWKILDRTIARRISTELLLEDSRQPPAIKYYKEIREPVLYDNRGPVFLFFKRTKGESRCRFYDMGSP